MEIPWYVQSSGQCYGPYTWQQLWWMSRQGRIGPADLVWHAGMSGWIPVGQMPGIGQAAPETGSVTRQRGNKGLVVSLIVLVVLVALTGTAALARQRRPDVAGPSTTVRTTARTTTGQQPGRTTRTTAATTAAATTIAAEVELLHNVPAPPDAKLVSSNRLYGYFHFQISQDTRIDTYCAAYKEMIEEAGYKVVPVWPCHADAAYFYIKDGHDHVASVEMVRGRVDVVFS